MNIEERISQLRLLKRHHDLEYWRDPLNGTSRSDEIYDQIKNELDNLLKEHPELKIESDDQLESIYMNTFAAVTHKYRMMSLGKALNIEDFMKWIKPLIADMKDIILEMIFEFKIDGFAISLEYEDGILTKASTRGDGVIGDDITPTVYLIPDIANKLDNNFTGEVGGEIYMKKSSLVKLNEKLKAEGKKELKNVRNAASGIARQKDTSTKMAEYLSFLCYRYVNAKKEYNTYKEEMDQAKQLGFATVFHDLNGIVKADVSKLSQDDIILLFKSFQDQREDLDLDIDGVVIKINNKALQDRLGDNEKIPNWAIAYKFPAMEKLTTLLDVEWELGKKDGRFTPMAVIEPVDIGGTTVKRPTLHNLDEIKRLGAKIGCTLRVSRRGDVIPKVEEAILELMPSDAREIIPPQVCPVCGEPTVLDGAFVKCNNLSCTGRISGRIRSYVISTEIENLGMSTIEKLIDADKLNSITDLYKLKKDYIAGLDKMGEKSAATIMENIEGSKKQPLWKVIAGLGIKNVGDKASKALEKNFGSFERISQVTLSDLEPIKDIGNVLSNNIVSWFSDEANKALVNELMSLGLGTTIEKIEVKENKLNGAKIAFTGKLSKWSRNECGKVIESNGGVVWDIKKEIDYLLIGEGAKDKKIEKAQKLGATIITESQFTEMIK
jgi:DNA ligase (NAD+)